jgi:hypothetical protein
VRAVLRSLRDRGDLDADAYRDRLAVYEQAAAAWRRLSGTRRREMQGVLQNLNSMAARGELTASRVPAVWTILDRNREWWTNGPLIRSGERVRFTGSKLIFEYYPGQGIQLHPLANFGRANGYWSGGFEPSLQQMLDELQPLAARRGGALVWEYYFSFGGGRPPWVSAMAQGAAIQAFARGAERLGEPSYMETARAGLRIYELRPPVGVRVPTRAGAHYLIYSFAPGLRVLNAFAYSLVGLFDVARLSGDARARTLFDAGDRQGKVETPDYDTGAWSLYSLDGAEANLNYQTLARDFLRELCTRTKAGVYCATATHFTNYLRTPPRITLLTRSAAAGSSVPVTFRVSKISRVGMEIRRGGAPVYSTSATVGYGRRVYPWFASSIPGTYAVRFTATDLAGNRSVTNGTLRLR